MSIRKQEAGKLYILSGPSGSGKSTILKGVLARLPEAHFSVSATTRGPRHGEVPGRDYHFMTKEEFYELAGVSGFLESAQYVGNWYGTPAAPIRERLARGVDVLLDIEVQGAAQVKERMPEAVTIFLFPPSLAILEQRLRRRGTDTEEKIVARMKRAREEYARALFYDYLVINDTREDAMEEVLAIIKAEHCKLESRRHLIT
ncbi:MAG: guanylate kinase [Oscillospiraceae bacterium]|nr:guanylate kinase [Oscillospiraceae bacterium]